MSSDLSPEQQREVVAKYQQLREEVDKLYGKLQGVDNDRSEHEVVLKQLTGMESDRRCWHQIGAVLAEKKVGDVVPILTFNRDQFVEVVKQLSETIKAKDKEIQDLQKKYGIREVRK